jgi:hypothetical protein
MPPSITNRHLNSRLPLVTVKEIGARRVHQVEVPVLNKFSLLLSEGKRFVLKICKIEVALGKARPQYCVNVIKNARP